MIKKQRYHNPETDKLNQSYYETKIMIDDLTESIKQSPVRRFVPLVTRSGNYRGEIKYLTKKQYRKYLRKEPNTSIIDKSGRIPWHYALDELSSESGFSSDEQFKEAIENLLDQKHQLTELKRSKKNLKNDIKESKTAKPKKEVIVIGDHAPVFPKTETTKAIIVTVNGLELKAQRNPSFYQVSDNNPSTPDYRVRYSVDARKLMNNAANLHIDEITGQDSVGDFVPDVDLNTGNTSRSNHYSKPKIKITPKYNGLTTVNKVRG
jgi:hypothetical protein